jgi:hypothetical protein
MSESNAAALLDELEMEEISSDNVYENADCLYEIPLDQLKACSSELRERLTVLVHLNEVNEEVDMRPHLLSAYCKLCSRDALRLEEELDFGDIAAALSYGLTVQAYKEVMISLTYAQAALPIASHFMETREGKRLLRRIRSTFEILFREEPELVRKLGWEIR